MDDGFYETLIHDVQTHMDHHEYAKAMALLEEEFSMPYIPKEYEEQLIPLYHACRSALNADKKVKSRYDEEDIETLLHGSLDEAFLGVEMLKSGNVRKHLDIVKAYLKHNPHHLIRTLLIECLIEQEVRDTFELDYDGLDISFHSEYVELPAQQDALIEAVRIVSSYYENENPIFLRMCVESMMKEMYFKMPFSLTEDEIYYFIYAILHYTYEANDDMEGFRRMIDEKKLANYSGYDLLLYKYGI